MKSKIILLGLLFATLATGAHVNDRAIYQTDVKNAQGTSVFKFPTAAPTASKAGVFNSDGEITSSSVSDTELNYLSGVSSSVQTQLNGKVVTNTDAILASLNITANVSTQNIYVATTGSDANDCLTVPTACLTIERGLSLIPVLSGGVYQLNLAAGSYTLASAYEFPAHISKSGNSDFSTVIKIVGASRATTTISAANSSSNIFNMKSRTVLIDIDKVTLSGGLGQVNVDGGFVYIRDVDFTGFFSSGIKSRMHGLIYLVDGTGTKTFTPSATSTNTKSIFIDTLGYINYSTDIVIAGVRGSPSSAIFCQSYGKFELGNLGHSNWTISTDASSPPRFLLFASNQSSMNVGGGSGNTVTLTGPIASSTGGYGAIRVAPQAFVSLAFGTSFSMNNLLMGFSIDPLAVVTESSGVTYSYTSVTTPVLMSHSSVVSSPSNFSGATVTYTDTAATSSSGFLKFGYDDRYVRVNRPTDQRRAIADVNATVLTSDSLIAYTSLTAGRTVTLPTCAAATAGITTAEQSRIFSVKDESGNAAGGIPITVSVSGGATIDGAATSVINAAYGKMTYYCVVGGTNYFTR